VTARSTRARVTADGRVPVVLVHGPAASSRYMVPLARVLAHDFDVLRPQSTGSRKKHQAADALPRGRLAVIPGAAHAINFGAPLELSRIVRSLARHIGCPTSA
jgi:pimeloyl-ACP methyl ester carboxylesterase